MEIKLSPYKKSEEKIFTNRDNGIRARKELKLDELEQKEGCIKVLLPSDIWGINPSFFGGMFESSIKEWQERFWDKYLFLYSNGEEINETLKASIEYDFDYVLNHMEK